MRILSALLSLFGLGNKSFAPAPVQRRALEHAPHIDPETHVYRSGRHSSSLRGECTRCGVTLSKRGRCFNRECPRFAGRFAKTHPDLLSLNRKTRRAAQERWATGGMAALFAH